MPGVQTFGIEISEPKVKFAEQNGIKVFGSLDEVPTNIKFHAVDLETIDLDLDTKFDIVLCADVVEHLADPNPCIEFIKTHMKPDGVALISTPERERLYGKHQLKSGHPCHVREWNYREFSAYLTSREFTIKQHVILHQKRQERTGFVSGAVRTALDRLGFHNSAFSCQLAICSLSSG